MENAQWDKLHYDLLQINENIMQLENALENSVISLGNQLQSDMNELEELENQILNLQEKIAKKLKELGNLTLENNGLNAMIGKHFPLKHKIMQDKFKLNEKCLKVLNSHKKLVNSISNTSSQLQMLNVNLQTLKSIRNSCIELEQNFGRQLNPGVINDNPYLDYQPLYMIEKTLNELNQLVH